MFHWYQTSSWLTQTLCYLVHSEKKYYKSIQNIVFLLILCDSKASYYRTISLIGFNPIHLYVIPFIVFQFSQFIQKKPLYDGYLYYTHNLSRLFSWSLLYELYKSLSDELSLHKNRSADVVGGYSNRCRFANVSNSNESIENMSSIFIRLFWVRSFSWYF